MITFIKMSSQKQKFNNLRYFILENSKILCHHKFKSHYHKNRLCYFILEKIKFLCHHK